MMTRIVTAGMVTLCLVSAMLLATPPSASTAPQPDPSPGAVLINTCLITSDVHRLAGFYERVLQIKPHWDGASYVEFRTGTAVLALFTADAQERYIPGSAAPAHNQSAILEFRVNDVDREYARLRDLVKWVKEPTTQPWGTRSIYFRDLDGNLVDFFVPQQGH